MTTRRFFLAMLAAPWAGRRLFAAATARAVAYRVDAVIVLFGRAIFTRTGVGEGMLLHEEAGAEGAETSLKLAFAGGSFPERARSLNRFGYFSELVKLPAGAPPEAGYFGFMTRSEEKSLSEAARSLEASAGAVNVSAIRGEVCNGHHRARLAVTPLAPGARWAVWQECLAEVVRSLAQDPAGETHAGREAHGNTFLHTVRQVLMDTRPRGETPFLYGRNPRRLVWRREADRKAAAEFASSRLIAAGREVVRLDAATVDDTTHRKSVFAIWYDPEARPCLPLRIELQPRSFLRLRLNALDSDPAALRADMEESFEAWRHLAPVSVRAGL